MDNPKGVHIAYLDDGNSISQLELLCNLMYRTQQRGLSALPSDCFDVVVSCGMSTVVNILITALKLAADDAAVFYQKIYRQVYQDSHFSAAERTGKLKECVVGLLEACGFSIDTKLGDSAKTSECFGAFPIFCVTTSQVVVWATSRQADFTPKDITIVDAIMASCSLPNHFLPILCDGLEYVATGLMNEDIFRVVLSNVLSNEQLLAGITRLGSDPITSSIIPSTPLERSWYRTLMQVVEGAATFGQQLNATLEYSGFYFHFGLPPPESTNSEYGNTTGRLVGQTSVYMNEPLVDSALNDCVENLKIRRGVVSVRDLTRSWDSDQWVNVPSADEAPFVMRPKLWSLMEEAMGCSQGFTQIMILSGGPGSGKSALASHFLQQHQGSFNFMARLDASSVTTLNADIVAAARSISDFSFSISVESALELFRDTKKTWCLFYDDANNITPVLPNLIPHSEKGFVLVTTQDDTLKELASHQKFHIDVGLMTDYEGADLFHQLSKSRPSEDLWEQTPRFVSYLQPLPITLSLSAAFLSQTQCLSEEYIQRHTEAFSIIPKSSEHHDETTILAEAAFIVTFRQLPANVRNFLTLFSFVHWSNFPIAAILVAAKSAFRREEAQLLELSGESDQAIEMLQSIFCGQGNCSSHQILEMVEVLKNFSLLSVIGSTSTILISVNPLIQRWTQAVLDESLHQVYQQAAIRLLSSSVGYVPIRRWLVPHIDVVVSYSLHINDSATFADIFKQMGRLNAAAILWRKVYDGLITHHGEDHPRVASAAIELAACLPPDFKQPTTPSEAEILSAEGNTVEEDHGEAVSEEDVQEDEGALDWSSLTETLIEDSIQMLRDVLDAIKVEDKGPLKILPPAPPSNHDPTSVNDLWSWYVYMNSINGEVHPETIYALIQVASGLQRHGKHIEAAGHFVDALRVTKERFGSAHIMTTYVVIELGFAFCMTQQKTAEGKALLSEAVNALEQLAESDSRFFLIVLSVRWANLYTVEERLDLVDEMLVQARRNLQILNMTNQRHLHHITLLLSAVRYLQDATSDSDDLLVQALEGLQEKFGDYCSGTREAMMALATVRDFQGRQEETEDLWKQILKSRRGEHGELHQETVSALDHLSNLYCQRMKYVSAYEVQTELLFAAQQLYGDRHPDCAAVMVRVGWTCLRLERMDEAEHLAREAKKILGEVNTHTSANESASELLELSERRIATMVKIDPPERLANPENQQVVMRRPRPLPMERKLGTWDTIEIKAQMGIHKFWELVQKD